MSRTPRHVLSLSVTRGARPRVSGGAPLAAHVNDGVRRDDARACPSSPPGPGSCLTAAAARRKGAKRSKILVERGSGHGETRRKEREPAARESPTLAPLLPPPQRTRVSDVQMTMAQQAHQLDLQTVSEGGCVYPLSHRESPPGPIRRAMWAFGAPPLLQPGTCGAALAFFPRQDQPLDRQSSVAAPPAATDSERV